MAERRSVERSGGTILLRPAAAPVDTFVDPGPNRLEGVAQSLKQLSGSLRGFMEQGDKEKAELDKIQGEADFYKQSGQSIAEGVRTEAIPANASPAYVESFKQAQGTAAGQRLRQNFTLAYDEWTGKDDATDADAYDQFFSTWVSEQIKDVKDPMVLRGILPQIRQMQQEGFQRHTVFRHEQLIDGNVRTAGAILNTEISELAAEGQSQPDGVDMQKVFEAADAQRKRLIEVGTPADKTDLMLMTTVAAQAEVLNDADLLQFFDRKVPGKDYTYGSTPDGLKLLATTRDRIQTNLAQADTASRAAAERREKQEKDRTTLGIMEALRTDPNAAIPEDLMVAARKANPKVDEEIIGWRKTFAGSGVSDPEALATVNQQIYDGGGREVVLDAARAGIFKNPSDFDAAMSRVSKVDENKSKMGEILQTPTAKNITDAIKQRTLKSEDFMNPVTGLSTEGMEADYDFRRQLNEWISANPNATSIEIDEAVAKIGTGILGNLKAGASTLPGTAGGQEYDRPKDAPGTNPYTALSEQESGAGDDAPFTIDPPKPAAPKEKGSSWWPWNWGGGETEAQPPVEKQGGIQEPEPTQAPDPTSSQDIMQSLTPEQRTAVEEAAREQGVTPEQFLQNATPGDEGQTPAASPINYTPSQPGDETFLRQFAVAGATREDSFSGMNPAFSSGLQAMLKAAPPKVAAELRIMSGYRSVKRQTELWNAALKKYGSVAAARKWVAPPGKSGHNHGHAADLRYASKEAREWAHANAGKFGLAFPLGNEPWHIELASARSGGGGGGFKVPQQQQATMVSAQPGDATGTPYRGFTETDATDWLDSVKIMPDLDFDDYDGSAATGDPKTDRLLNLIGQGESGNNYNAVFGNAASEVDLGQMTLEQVMEAQAKAVAAGSPSSAIGKYQILRQTHEQLRQELGLTGKEKYTPRLQDTMALALLQRRGYDKWKSGALSTAQFARRLSQEWAALPNPETGNSYYQGDGLNKARVSPKQVYAALGLLDT